MANGAGSYVLVTNTACSPANLLVAGPGTALRDVETGTVYPVGSPIPFRGGDGKLFAVVP
jgi:hypothetical protein